MWWQTSNCSSLLIYRPREDERLSWPGWLTYGGRLTYISGHPSATGRAQDGERTLARDWRSTSEPRRPQVNDFIWADIMFLLFPRHNMKLKRSTYEHRNAERFFDEPEDISQGQGQICHTDSWWSRYCSVELWAPSDSVVSEMSRK